MTSEQSPATWAADFGSRFSAFMIDAVALFAAQWIIVIVASRQLQAIGMTAINDCDPDPEVIAECEGPSSLLWALLFLFLIISTIAYYARFESRGSTPGKKLMGLSVVDYDNGEAIGSGRATVRALIRQSPLLLLFIVLEASPLAVSLPAGVSVILLLGSLVAVGSAAFKADGRGVHDLAAGSLVVRSDEVQTRVLEEKL